MALINCSECQKEVSSAASACPSCGHPVNSIAGYNDPATFEIALGRVPSLWRVMQFTFKMNNKAPSKVHIQTYSTSKGKMEYIAQTMGEEGIKNLREMCDKALAYFDRAKNGPKSPNDATAKTVL